MNDCMRRGSGRWASFVSAAVLLSHPTGPYVMRMGEIAARVEAHSARAKMANVFLDDERRWSNTNTGTTAMAFVGRHPMANPRKSPERAALFCAAAENARMMNSNDQT